MREAPEDRITNLPGSILHHILSFVDTRDAARTCVLSKRWKYIWRSIPNLHFQCWSSSQSQVSKFMDFVDKTLELHDESNIQKFSLVISTNFRFNEPRIKNWISTVISHNVEELDLRLNHRGLVLMPSSLCTCESLVTLKLDSIPNICFPRNISLPRLESLVLTEVAFRDECWYEQLFSNCPVLELLMMVSCTWSDMKSFCISNPALKHLLIVNADFRNCALKIHAPRLEILSYIGRVAKDYILSGFPTLVKAYIQFFFEQDGAMWEHYGAVVSKFLLALTRVVNLRISGRTLQVLSIADGLLNNLPSFHNLRKLSLIDEVTADKALIALLETAPNLESLEFEGFAPPFPNDEEDDDDADSGDEGVEDNHYNENEAGDSDGEDNNDNESDGWELDMVPARCSFLHLKLVTFLKFTGKAKELRWVKLILKNAKSLQTMNFHPISHMKSEKIMADISNLPRASTNCVFKVVSMPG